MATTLGIRLRAVRERLGLSRLEVARRAGVDPAQLFRIENADNAAPTFEVVTRVARVLDVGLDWLARSDEDLNYEKVGAPIILDGQARRALLKASQSLEEMVDRITRSDASKTKGPRTENPPPARRRASGKKPR